jgi:hypothetical protein
MLSASSASSARGASFFFFFLDYRLQVVSNNIIQIYIIYLYIIYICIFFYLYFSSIVVDVVGVGFFVFGGALLALVALVVFFFLFDAEREWCVIKIKTPQVRANKGSLFL